VHLEHVLLQQVSTPRSCVPHEVKGTRPDKPPFVLPVRDKMSSAYHHFKSKRQTQTSNNCCVPTLDATVSVIVFLIYNLSCAKVLPRLKLPKLSCHDGWI